MQGYGGENEIICGHVETSENDDECQKQSQPATLLKKRLWHRCFPVNFSKFLGATFLTEHLRWLFLECAHHQENYNEGDEWLCCPVCHQWYHEDYFFMSNLSHPALLLDYINIMY